MSSPIDLPEPFNAPQPGERTSIGLRRTTAEPPPQHNVPPNNNDPLPGDGQIQPDDIDIVHDADDVEMVPGAAAPEVPAVNDPNANVEISFHKIVLVIN